MVLFREFCSDLVFSLADLSDTKCEPLIARRVVGGGEIMEERETRGDLRGAKFVIGHILHFDAVLQVWQGCTESQQHKVG